MATVTPPYADPGRAAYEELDTYLQNFLLAGSHPALAPGIGFPMDNNTAFAQFEVVGLDASGNLTAAVWDANPANAVTPIGIMAHSATLGATGTMNGQVWYSGCFNMDALVWDASFDTDAKKEAAFRGAPTPTNVIIGKRAA